jgi:D-alanyl-D-alanine carboxypeptidase
VRPGEQKALENRLRASKRHRNRWLVVALALACAFALGYAFLALEQGRIPMAIRPTALSEAPSPPQAVDPGGPSAEDNELASGQSSQEENHTTSSRHPAAEESCNDMRVLVDRSHRLPRDYAPEDLISLLSNDVPTLGGGEMLLRREAAEHLRSLVADAAADGEELVVASAYRSYADQRVSYRRLRSIYGSEADLMSARPGHSQHQLGTAVDFTNTAADHEVWQAFGHTSAFRWLKEHAPEYGFVLAYPRGGEVRGYQWEPWHYRYVGAKNAERLEESGLPLQEFLVRQGVMPGC